MAQPQVNEQPPARGKTMQGTDVHVSFSRGRQTPAEETAYRVGEWVGKKMLGPVMEQLRELAEDYPVAYRGVDRLGDINPSGSAIFVSNHTISRYQDKKQPPGITPDVLLCERVIASVMDHAPVVPAVNGAGFETIKIPEIDIVMPSWSIRLQKVFTESPIERIHVTEIKIPWVRRIRKYFGEGLVEGGTGHIAVDKADIREHREFIEKIDTAVGLDTPVLFFGEGFRRPPTYNFSEGIQVQRGAASLAKRYAANGRNVPLIPMYIHCPGTWKYDKQIRRETPVMVAFGTPIDVADKSPKQITEEIEIQIAGLQQELIAEVPDLLSQYE